MAGVKKDFNEYFDEYSSSTDGISAREAKKRLSVYGLNELEEKQKITPIKVFYRQLGNFIIWVLAAAALISYYIDEVINFWVINSIIVFVLILGFVQEYRAEKAMESLRNIMMPTTRVVRDGILTDVQTREVVPGDVLDLENGDNIPADSCIFELNGFRVDESSLTGESVPVEKDVNDLIFAGTQAVGGKCKAVVISTGMNTELGKIAGLIQESEEETPLQKSISNLAKVLAAIALSASTFSFLLGVTIGAPIGEMLVIALALAVASVPSGLPLIITITLAHGMRKMAENNAIIRKMLAVESLGSTSVICTDKTGTLTQNEMTVECLFVDGQIVEVTGSGYVPEGTFLVDGNAADLENYPDIRFLLQISALCNNSGLVESNGAWQSAGDPTEVALLTAALKAGFSKEKLDLDFERIDEIVFTSERKMMTTIHRSKGSKIAYTKGACSIVLDKCSQILENGELRTINSTDKNRILSENDRMANDAYRVLAVAFRDIHGNKTGEEIETDLVFVGLMAMIDPVRAEVPKAVSLCREAGIKVIMITGDNGKTAKAIASRVGIKTDYSHDPALLEEGIEKIVSDGVITGEELEYLDDSEFQQVVEHISVYARVMPKQKLRIVKALKNKGHVVAMTGDGVNDAPALKTADIGVSMGKKGTDVARESSVMVLQDDDFSTIVEAVKQGRAIYENIEKFTSYLVSRNFTELILILLGISILGFDLVPLLALQILFINMFDEIMPAIALGLDPAKEDVMRRKPRPIGEKILGGSRLAFVVIVAMFMGLSCFGVYLHADPFNNLIYARTVTFAAIVSMILFVPFAFRSLKNPILNTGLRDNPLMIVGVVSAFLLTMGVMYIPFFASIFELVPLGLAGWIVPVSVAFGVLVGIEALKVIIFKKGYSIS
ncbi:Ca2+-transporting ATPase [Methanohalophilus levihalophilus]|uniref:cation-translocating P-type ATPase n=1 Tax=Methanohalophilus levihalophilus TaxID=1431282 RepID=UPI001AE2BADC|nr:cation-translocating P-type ATPase [Methanohalophilus levihalophilus]MBP2029882.1 Ca2+-transporting ATPase [Methanohalophilus levihalophilus]